MSKNIELAEDFYNYCKNHPELRFWQALRAWSGVWFVGISNDGIYFKDTFFWEGKDK